MNTLKFLVCLVLFTSFFTMDELEFETLLGKHLSFAKEFTNNDFKSNNFKSNNFEVKFYSNKDYTIKDFYGMSYNYITIMTNEKDTVQSITVHFRKIITRQFYDSIIKKYGEPNNIQVIENRQTESESTIKDDNGKIVERLSKSSFDLREGSFDESPLYIIWKKETFNIKVFLRHEQNMSEITFSIK